MKVWEQNFNEIEELYDKMRQPVLSLLKQKSAEDALPIIWAAIAELHFGTLFMIQAKISDQKTVTMLRDLWEWIGNQKKNEIVRATSVDITKAEQILGEHVEKQEQASSQATVAGKTIRADDLSKAADKLIFTEGFSEGPTVQKFGKAMSGKIPLRFYGVKGLQNIDPQDAFGFAIAFTATGYAVAKASKGLLGHSAYVTALPAEVVRKLRSGQHEKGIPIGYNIDVLQAGNPIPWKLIDRVLESCIESNLVNLLNRLPWARSSAEVIKEHLVKEFVLVGYYIGLWENTA